MKYESSSESESEIELQDSEIWSTQMDDQNLSVVLEYVVSDFFKEIADMGSQEIEPKELLLKTGNDIRIVVEHVPQENPIMTLIVSGKRYTLPTEMSGFLRNRCR